MSTMAEQSVQTVTCLLNGTCSSIKNVVPLNLRIEAPRVLGKSLDIEFGVLIGITGDIKGKLVLTGESRIFGAIGQAMFGMPLEGEMLSSFSGELGNMIAGGLSSNMYNDGFVTDITAPMIIEGNTSISGFKKALYVPAAFENAGEMGIYLLID